MAIDGRGGNLLLRHIGLGLVLAAAPAVALAASYPSIGYDWRSVTVGGGGFAPGVVFSPVERGLAYLRTDMGGAYRWDEAADRWIPLEDSIAIGSYMGVESVVADPVDPDIVYLAVGMSSRSPAAVLRSHDRGAHWQEIVAPAAPLPFSTTGSTMRKVLPFPTSLSTSMRPPCASTAQRASESPRPAPPRSRERALSTR